MKNILALGGGAVGYFRILRRLFLKACAAFKKTAQKFRAGFSRTADTAGNSLEKCADRQQMRRRLLNESIEGQRAKATPVRSRCTDPVYFQLFYADEARYRAEIEKTHEPAEIKQLMRMRVSMTHIGVRIQICVFDADTEIVKKYAKGDFSELISAAKYAEKHERSFSSFQLLELAFKEYRPPNNAEELLLKAEIAGDEKWADFWRKYTAAN